MKIIAVICNIILFFFTCLVLKTDGLPMETAYIIFTLWMLLSQILNAVVISRFGTIEGWMRMSKKNWKLEKQNKSDDRLSASTILRIAAIVGNIGQIGFVCWALTDQYPHPQEEGFIPYVMMTVFTPLLSLAVLLWSATSADRPDSLIKKSA